MLGEKWEEIKRCFSFSFHWPLNIGTFHWPPNIGTFHWPLNWDLSSSPFFSFSLKGVFKSFGTLFFGHNFQFESWEYLFLQPSLRKEEQLVLINDGKGKVNWMFVVLLKEWKWVKIMLGAWNFRNISQTLLGLVTQLLTSLGVGPRIW